MSKAVTLTTKENSKIGTPSQRPWEKWQPGSETMGQDHCLLWP